MSAAKLVSLHWSAFPIRYFVTNRDIAGVSAPQLQQAVGSALSTWAAVPGAAISSRVRRLHAAPPRSRATA